MGAGQGVPQRVASATASKEAGDAYDFPSIECVHQSAPVHNRNQRFEVASAETSRESFPEQAYISWRIKFRVCSPLPLFI